ncbi:E3 ubiquitin-protein ligase PUB24 [Bienertia sinuspersici]
MMDEHDEEVEVPQYFVCPISLQIMKDPVTAATGITYDRCSIERWLKAAEAVCPVTKQPLPNDQLTPNHTLRRLIQAWCVANGAQRIPTPKPVLCRAHLSKILRGVTVTHLQSPSSSLDQLLSLVSTGKEQDLKLMADCGVAQAMVGFIIKCYNQRDAMFVDQAFRILTPIWILSSSKDDIMVACNSVDIDLFFDAIAWVLLGNDVQRRSLAVNLLREMVKLAPSTSTSALFERLKPDFFKGLAAVLVVVDDVDSNGNGNINSNAKAAIRVLVEVCKHGRNKYKIIEANTIFHLIELEFGLGLAQPEKNKRISELVFCLLAQLCSCADGRAQLVAHSGAIAVLSKRMLRVSAMVDDRAIHILGLLCKYSATYEVLHEMLKVGAVSKMCMVLQTDCGKYLKDKIREMLRMHSYVWNNSPCIQLYLLTRYPMLQF